MINLFERLPETDRTLMKDYIYWYAANRTEPTESLSYIMRIWNDNKQYLYNLFGEKFILEREIEYKMPIDDIARDINEKIGEYVFFNKYQLFLSSLREKYYKDDNYWDIYDGAYRLINSYILAKNKFDGKTFSLEIPETDRKITVQIGCKPIKVLAKIAKEFHIDGFEEFRLMHSMALNQKKIKGTLCLSIHPLDYMTMSDNDSDWSSCMSWRDNGCYRQGTVEMMNSNNVIVAYIKSDNNVMSFSNKCTWNDKKWRELFICDEEVITGVKAYPYANYELTKIINNWIKELRIAANPSEKFGKYTEIHPFDINLACNTGLSKDYNIDFETGNMYNDFGAAVKHFGYFSIENIKENSFNQIYIRYSGPSECMICGCEEPEINCEGDLACDDCIPHIYCDFCDDCIDGDYSYTVDGWTLCEYCYDHYTQEDIYSNVHLIQECARFSLCTEDYSEIYDTFSFVILAKDVERNDFKFLKEHFDLSKIQRMNVRWHGRDTYGNDFIVPLSGLISNTVKVTWGERKIPLFTEIDPNTLEFTDYAKEHSSWMLSKTELAKERFHFILSEDTKNELSLAE